jgi:DNA-binding MarR family transcriptional regulator
MKDKGLSSLDLDKLIHERSRLMILTCLSSSERGEAGFTELRDSLGLSAGNLSIQVKTLEEAGYLRVEKSFVANKSYTGISITREGQKALSAYLAELEVIVASLKHGARMVEPEHAGVVENGGKHGDPAIG